MTEEFEVDDNLRPIDSPDPINLFAVGLQGDTIVVLNPPRLPMTYDVALNLAAWLVVLADGRAGHSFDAVLSAVHNS